MRFKPASLGLIPALLLLAVPVASAQNGLALLCSAMPDPNDCLNAGNELVFVIRDIGFLLLEVAAAVAMFFIVWGGMLIVTSAGDESKAATGRFSVIYAMIGLVVALSAQMFLLVLTPLGSVTTVAQAAEEVINIPRNLLNLVFSVMIVWTAFRLVLARGKSDEVETGRRMLFYAIVGAVVVNLATALFAAVANLFI
jgi:uncharacterized BrkB/YihY/UPF0761 family membrane protein